MGKRIKDALILFAITLVAGIGLGAAYAVTKEPIAQAEYNKTQAAYMEVFEDADHFEQLEDFDSAEATEAAIDELEEQGLSDSTITPEDCTVDDCQVAYDASGEEVGYVITVTSSAGYGGDITLSVGIQDDDTVNGYSITTINETAGLGMNAKEEGFSSQFDDKQVDFFTVTKSGSTSDEQIDAISGATITSKAVTSAVDVAIAYDETLDEGGEE